MLKNVMYPYVLDWFPLHNKTGNNINCHRCDNMRTLVEIQSARISAFEE